MKRLLAIFIVLLLVLGGLFWWRKNQNVFNNQNYIVDLTSDTDEAFFMPLISNLLLFEVTSHGIHNNFIQDYSPFQKIPSLNNFKEQGVFNVLWHGLYSTSLKEWGVVKEFDIVNKYIVLHVFKNNNSYYKIIDSNHQVYVNNYTLGGIKEEIIKLGIQTPLNLKTPEEWLEIWKRDGRLPWFPEHVGR